MAVGSDRRRSCGGSWMPPESLSAHLLRRILRSRARGSTRLAILLAQASPQWREAPVQVGDSTVFVDLREASSHGLFVGQLPEESERRFLQRRVGLGQVVVDVGSHWGLYTVQLASQVGPGGRVFAFEPCPSVLPCLRRTVAALPNVTLFPAAASDNSGTTSFTVPPDASMASLADWTGAGRRVRTYAIETVRIDDLLQDGRIWPADFVKCDVEGAEALVVRGAIKFLNRPAAPVVMLEVNSRAAGAFGLKSTQALDCLAQLEAARYGFFALDGGGRLVPLSASPERAWNVFAVPARRAQWLEAGC